MTCTDPTRGSGRSGYGARMMKNYTIRAEPTGHVYQALLGLSLQHCETFILVVGSERLLERPGRDVLERLSPLVITRSEEQEWPGIVRQTLRDLVLSEEPDG